MIDDGVVPVPQRLFTWLDVDQHFAELASLKIWPEWLIQASAFWDGLHLVIANGVNADTVWSWLAAALGPITVDASQQCIFLEKADSERILPVHFDFRSESSAADQKLQWAHRRIVPEIGNPIPYPEFSTYDGEVSLCSFHSYKGGVGRTLHCVALAANLSSSGVKVLVIDADLEAPGISWMAASQGARLDFSFEDFLALLHGSDDEHADDAIAIARKFLLNQSLGDVFVLPARRSSSSTRVPRVDPVDLLVAGRSRYFLTESIALLGKAIGVDVVLVDLRAGISELNAPMLLDPRVTRVFVTTVSDQSVQGTTEVLSELARRAPGRSLDDPFCSVLITQFDSKRHAVRVEEAAARFSQSIAETVDLGSLGPDESDLTSIEMRTQPIVSPFDPRLLALPAAWDDVCDVIQTVGLTDVVEVLADDLRRGVSKDIVDETSGEPDVFEKRRHLFEHARRLKFAETAGADLEFLATESLTNLVSSHRTDSPIEVVVGAKGSGKTFTYQAICGRRDWSTFAQDAGVSGVEFSAPVVPVLSSGNFSSNDWLIEARVDAAQRLGFEAPVSSQQIQDIITDAVAEERSDSDWRRVWLACIARAAGITCSPLEAEDRLVDLARVKRAVFVVDGLEDLFRDFATNGREQQALRVLLTSIPDWFRSLRGRLLGLVVFVRRDLVRKAISQNSAQFLARYQSYQLKWDSTEVLRLVAWLIAGSGVDGQFRSERVSTLERAALSELLLSVWGQQLGSAKSREARSEAWFLAALTDFSGQIQARDIVTFIAEAARLAANEPTGWPDRLLTPTSMRQSLPECSRSKIDEIEEENIQLKLVFGKLRDVPVDDKTVPFDEKQVGLTPGDIDVLNANGVVFEDDGKYWMPEIYRIGLGFRPAAGGRSRVLMIAKRVARMNDTR